MLKPLCTGLHPEVLRMHRKDWTPLQQNQNMHQGLIARRLTSRSTGLMLAVVLRHYWVLSRAECIIGQTNEATIFGYGSVANW